MTPSFEKLDYTVNVGPIVAQLAAHPELWGQQTARTIAGSPHDETQDIWLRYRDLNAYRAEYGDDMSHFCDEHESVWLPPADKLRHASLIARTIAHRFEQSAQFPGNLGGVLITKTPPGGRIKPHIDRGWHAEAHDKYYVALQVAPGMRFCWEDGTIEAKDGEVYKFQNDRRHWCENDSDIDRISMIVCVRRN